MRALSPARGRDRDWAEAGRRMSLRGIPGQDHEALQENLATYLSHRHGDTLGPRWQSKVDRDLARPFKDEQVGQRLEALQLSLRDLVEHLPAYPSKIYLTGSFARGRLGANSDLDGYAVLKPEHLAAGWDSYEHTVESGGACLFPMSERTPGFNRANLLYAGASVAINPQRLSTPGYLGQVYESVLEQRPAQRQETHRLYEWATGKLWKEGLSASQKREEFEGKSLKSRLIDACLSLGGTLSLLPLVGPVVMKAADLAVRQSHLDQSR